MEQGRRGTAPVLGSGKLLYAYGTQANVNQIGLLYFLLNHLGTSINSQLLRITPALLIIANRRMGLPSLPCKYEN